MNEEIKIGVANRAIFKALLIGALLGILVGIPIGLLA